MFLKEIWLNNDLFSKQLLTSVFGIHEFLPNTAILSIFGSAACRDAAFTQAVCNNILFLIAGFNEDQMNSVSF